MRKRLTSWAGSVVLALWAMTLHGAAQAPVPGQVESQIERCLHDTGETSAEKARRTEALAAMRMIGYVVGKTPVLLPSRLTWQRLAASPVVDELRGMDGAVGDLARKMAWGDIEPLPGWRITWMQAPATLQAPTTILFALTDHRDPCMFRYSSNDPDIMRESRGGVRLLPLDVY